VTIISAQNIAEAFHKRIELNPARICLLRKQVDSWLSLSWREVEERVFELAHVLTREGIQKGDRVAILAHNQPRWAMSDFAILSIGAVSVPIYPSLMSDDIFFILNDAQVKAIIVDTDDQLSKIKSVRDKLPHLKSLLSLNALSNSNTEAICVDAKISEYRNMSESLTDGLSEWRQLSKEIKKNDVASVVYTSGTTGEPKGVVLTHSHFLNVAEQALSTIDFNEDDVSLFFLPPAHVLGRVEQFLSVMAGWTTAYCEDLHHFVDNLMEVNPTFFIAVPRIFEKIFDTISIRFQTTLPFGSTLFQQALKVAEEYSLCLEKKKKPSFLLLHQYKFFNSMLYSKVRKRFGTRLRFAIVGGAMMSEKLLRFFHTCGVLVLEGYGLTETTGPVSLNTPRYFRLGTVGRLFFQNRVKISPDGELLLKGPSLFHEYLNTPPGSSKNFDDGYFCTGDVGKLDFEGFLKITDRKKDVIVSSGGKKISPQKVEQILKENPLISQALVVGGEGKALGVLLSLHQSEARRIFREEKESHLSFEQWYQGPNFKLKLEKLINELTSKIPPYERPKRWALLPRELSIEAGELTPSLKIRRKFCKQKFAALIEEMLA
jgi:long-chain acyl-CoA synthetase